MDESNHLLVIKRLERSDDSAEVRLPFQLSRLCCGALQVSCVRCGVRALCVFALPLLRPLPVDAVALPPFCLDLRPM
jgi:hypothetical protein